MQNTKWKQEFKEGKELILTTCSNNREPNANIVISLGFIDGKLLIADCQMKTTIKNLKQNKKICIVGGYYRLKGIVDIINTGEYFDICVKKSKGYKVKNAIIVNIKSVFDLDKQEEIKLGI